MSKNILTFLKVIISIALAGFLLHLVFKNIDWDEFWSKALDVNYSWVIISIVLSIVAYVARAYRWNLLLRPLGYDLKTHRTTIAVLVGYLANLAIPRLGEITRCGVLNRNDKVPVSVGLGSVVVDRVLDMAMLLVLILVSLLVEFERLSSFLQEAYKDLNIPTWVPYAIVFIGLLGLVFLVLIIKRRNQLKGKLGELVNGFLSGFLSLKGVTNPLGVIISTLIIWVVYYLMSYIIVFSLPETNHLGLGAGFMLLVTGGIAISLPVQSGFGTYHGMIAGMLVLYSIDQSTGLFLATLLHTSQILAVAFFGTIALFVSFLMRRKIDRGDKA